MIAHLTRKKLVRGDARTGRKEYEPTALRWSGKNASGDELEGPACYVIDVGRDFTMSFDGKLYLTGEGTGRFKTFTPQALGVKAVVVDRKGTDHQHIDLCGIPLKRARAMAQFELLTAPEIAPELFALHVLGVSSGSRTWPPGSASATWWPTRPGGSANWRA